MDAPPVIGVMLDMFLKGAQNSFNYTIIEN